MLSKKGAFPSSWVKKGYVFVDPSDKNVYPPELYTVDPAIFTPVPFTEVGAHRNWALEDPEVDSHGKPIEMMKRFTLKAAAFSLYTKYPSPFEQYIATIAQRKVDAVASPEVQAASKLTLMIRIELTRNGGDCCRIFSVPASTPLSVFHEKILGPIMGWSKRRHGYVFQDPRDGAVIGPKKSDFADMKHANLKFNAFMDDKKLLVASLLQKVGDFCWYAYDLNDHWEHGLKVVQIITEGEEGYNEVRLLAGRGACPGEESVGLEGKGCEAYANFLHTYQHQPQLCKKALKAIANADNHIHRPFEYDPMIFHMEYHQAELAAALTGTDIFVQPVLAIQDLQIASSASTVDTNVSRKGCWHCGNTQSALMKCGKCNTASYCCRGCQVSNWKTHKDECKTLTTPVIEVAERSEEPAPVVKDGERSEPN